jgi:FixJ family two-component response regulator
MIRSDFTVFLIDDDPSVLKALTRLLQTEGYKTQAFSSPQIFLSEHDPAVSGCAVIDVAMPGLDGLALQQALTGQTIERPIIFLSGHGNIPISVRAMRAGAVDFLLKPVSKTNLLEAIARAAEQDEILRRKLKDRKSIYERLETLTPREREVLTHVIAGRLNKQIAGDLGTVEKTIKVHRSRMMIKMAIKTVAELVRLTESVGLQPRRFSTSLAPKANSTEQPSAAQTSQHGNIKVPHCDSGR